VLPNSQHMPTLAAQVDALLDRRPMWGYLIDGHGLYAWGRDMAEARRHLEAFEFLLGCELDLRRLSTVRGPPALRLAMAGVAPLPATAAAPAASLSFCPPIAAREPAMSRLRIFSDPSPDAPDVTGHDGDGIARELAKIGVRFERWQAS